MTIRTKADVLTHRDGWAGPQLPALNVKMRRYVTDLTDAEWETARADAGLTWSDFGPAWIAAHMTDEQVQTWIDIAADDAREMFANDAAEVDVTIESEGRSGGWLTIRGMGHIDEWDAIALGKYRKLSRWAAEYVAAIPQMTAVLIGMNVYDGEIERFAKIEERRNDVLADAVTA